MIRFAQEMDATMQMTQSFMGRPVRLFLQHPASALWMHMATLTRNSVGMRVLFQYTDAYLNSTSAVAIDPVNLPLCTERIEAPRYAGMPDAVRDICPDAWGTRLLSRSESTEPLSNWRLLTAGGAFDRWGALSVSSPPQRSFEFLSGERITHVCAELTAIQRRLPARDSRVRQKILSTPNLGGARPKTTIKDEQSLWVLKPKIESDDYDVPALEQLTAILGSKCKLNFAESRHLVDAEGHSAFASKRFDRDLNSRSMVLSAATLLGVEYPPLSSVDRNRANYGSLAEVLIAIGAPVEDCVELYRRMAFNALVGNDDDHPRNHAVVYSAIELRWRLAPAYDVVPNLLLRPTSLAMGLDNSVNAISKQALLEVAPRFGIQTQSEADDILNSLSLNLCKALVEQRSRVASKLMERLEQNVVHGMKLLDVFSVKHQDVLTQHK